MPIPQIKLNDTDPLDQKIMEHKEKHYPNMSWVSFFKHMAWKDMEDKDNAKKNKS